MKYFVICKNCVIQPSGCKTILLNDLSIFTSLVRKKIIDNGIVAYTKLQLAVLEDIILLAGGVELRSVYIRMKCLIHS